MFLIIQKRLNISLMIKRLKLIFPQIYGDKFKMVPKGFPKDFPDINFLKHKDYAAIHKLDNDFFLQDDVLTQLLNIYEIQKPFNDFLNESLEKMQ
ncbi:MAG: hypothetical protein CR968_03590 [Flavobacteriia bacterium]|nr:MAG: hypothetical protein CR968_03590 [Flavobacteriia bacterium]